MNINIMDLKVIDIDLRGLIDCLIQFCEKNIW